MCGLWFEKMTSIVFPGKPGLRSHWKPSSFGNQATGTWRFNGGRKFIKFHGRKSTLFFIVWEYALKLMFYRRLTTDRTEKTGIPKFDRSSTLRDHFLRKSFAATRFAPDVFHTNQKVFLIWRLFFGIIFSLHVNLNVDRSVIRQSSFSALIT